MKKLFLLFMLLICSDAECSLFDNYTTSSGNPPTVIRSWKWGEFEHVIFVLHNHWYLEVRYVGSDRHSGAAVTVTHLQSCPCMNRL